jgi:hypothetical protein
LGKAAFDDHNYYVTICALDHFFKLYTPTPSSDPIYAESLYMYGETIRKERYTLWATDYFLEALKYIDLTKDSSYPVMILQAELFYKLNTRFGDPLTILQSIYWMSGRSPDATANYANMLLDAGYLEHAKRILRLQY